MLQCSKQCAPLRRLIARDWPTGIAAVLVVA
jgi:hypothetical protein